MTKHFYIYNETHLPIRSTIAFVPLDGNGLTMETLVVPSGNQTMLCTTEQDTIATESVSVDGSLQWKSQTIQLDGEEYTHVISVRLPEPWPNAASRQYQD